MIIINLKIDGKYYQWIWNKNKKFWDFCVKYFVRLWNENKIKIRKWNELRNVNRVKNNLKITSFRNYFGRYYK